MTTAKAKVLIMMGSVSDHEVMKQARDILTEFGVQSEYRVASAHRCPELVAELAKTAKDRGIKVVIAGAGGAAHLPGVVAAYTTLPVIGVPIESTLDGLDSLLSIAQMPGGIPVATMSIGKSGAKNAGLFALEILALSDPQIAEQYTAFRKQQAEKVINAKFPD